MLSLQDILKASAALAMEHSKGVTTVNQVTSVTPINKRPYEEQILSGPPVNKSSDLNQESDIIYLYPKESAEAIEKQNPPTIPQKFMIQKINIMLEKENSRKECIPEYKNLTDLLLDKGNKIMIPVDSAPPGSVFISCHEKIDPWSNCELEKRAKECWNWKKWQVIPCQSPNHFVGAGATAYSYHLPLRLKPDYFFIMMMQGFSIWLENFGGANVLRTNGFVGEKKTVVFRPDEKDWKGSLKDLCNQAFDNLFTDPDLKTIFMTRFSTTTEAMDFAHTLSTVNATKSLVNIKFSFMCGIPYITLEGCESDWAMLQLVANCINLVSGGQLNGWFNVMMPALQTIVDSFSNDETVKERSTKYWNNFVNYGGSSMVHGCSGWINAFIPFIRDQNDPSKIVKNPTVWQGSFEDMNKKHDSFDDWKKFVEITDYMGTVTTGVYESISGRRDTIIKAGIVSIIQWTGTGGDGGPGEDFAVEPFLSSQVNSS